MRHPFQGDPLRRWKRGHHLFFVLIQGMVLGLRRYEAALQSGDTERARSALIGLADLLYGATVALRFCGTFLAAPYNARVRPDMESLDPKFSGLFSADHAVMIRMLPVLKNPPSPLLFDHARVTTALHVAYEAHACVCERFVRNRRSLAQSQANLKSGAEMLRGHYKARALRMAGRSNSLPS